MPVSNFDAKAVIDWEKHLLESRTKRGTPYTVTCLNTLCSQLSAIMNHLVRFHGLERNPVRIAGKIGSKEKREMSIWTREQYLRFLDAVADKSYSNLTFEIILWCSIHVGKMLGMCLFRRRYTKEVIHQMKADSRKPGYGV